MRLLLQPCHPKLFGQRKTLPRGAGYAARLAGLARIGAFQHFAVSIRKRLEFFDCDSGTRSGPIKLLLVGEFAQIGAVSLMRIVHQAVRIDDIAVLIDLDNAFEQHRENEPVTHLQNRAMQDIVIGEVVARQMAVVAVEIDEQQILPLVSHRAEAAIGLRLHDGLRVDGKINVLSRVDVSKSLEFAVDLPIGIQRLFRVGVLSPGGESDRHVIGVRGVGPHAVAPGKPLGERIPGGIGEPGEHFRALPGALETFCLQPVVSVNRTKEERGQPIPHHLVGVSRRTVDADKIHTFRRLVQLRFHTAFASLANYSYHII